MATSAESERELAGNLNALVSQFMGGHETPGLQPQTEIRRFVDWVTPYLHLWKGIELAMVVARPGDTWIAMLCRCVLVESATRPAERVGTARLQLVRTVIPIASLPAIIEQCGGGWLGEAATPLGERVRLGDNHAAPWQRLHGWPREPVASSTGGPMSRYLRYELEFETGAALDRDVEPSQVYEWLSTQRDHFEGEGHGTLIAQLKKAGLVVGLESLESMRTRRTTWVAPVPIRLATVEQSNDRHTVAVSTQVASSVRLGDVRVLLEDSEQLAPHRASPDSHGTVAFHTVAPGKARVSVAYLGKIVDRHEVEVHAKQRRSARACAIALFEGKQELLAKGLRPEELASPDNDAFERSVAHLLGLLGFSSLWWGANRMKAGVPQDQADILAFPPHDGAVLVVDATIEPNKDSKVAKLIARTGVLEQTLQAELADPLFVAIPVLAVAANQRVVPQGWSEHDVEILTGEKLKAALEALRRGEAIEDIWAGLSTRVRDALVRPRWSFSIW